MGKVTNSISRAGPLFHFAGAVSQATSLFVMALTRETVFNP
jgi:hypothetical protein